MPCCGWVFGVCCFPIVSLALVQEPTVQGEKEEKVRQIYAVKVETLADGIDGGTGGLAVDSNGNLFSADFGWNLGGKGKGGDQVFKITPAGKVSLFCRQMRGASGNAFDGDGNLIQSSIGGNTISKITPLGEVSIVAREGIKNPVGVVVDSAGHLFVCNCGSASIQRITPDRKSTPFCQSNLLKCPNGIVIADDGNFYVANFSNGDVIKIDPAGKASKLVTLPGNNNGHLTFHRGDLYVVARSAHQIYRVNLQGQATVFVGTGKRGKADGDPLESSLSLPNDIVVSPDGKFMYVNETSPIVGDPRVLGPTRIRRISLGDAKK